MKRSKLVPILCKLIREVNPNIDPSKFEDVSATALLFVLNHELLQRDYKEARTPECRAAIRDLQERVSNLEEEARINGLLATQLIKNTGIYFVDEMGKADWDKDAKVAVAEAALKGNLWR